MQVFQRLRSRTHRRSVAAHPPCGRGQLQLSFGGQCIIAGIVCAPLAYMVVSHSALACMVPLATSYATVGVTRARRHVVVAATRQHAVTGRRVPRERVLRYPSGETRYIRYPSVEATFDDEADDSGAGWDVAGVWAVVQSSGGATSAAVAASPAADPAQQDAAAFLESLFAASYSDQPLLNVAGSYRVLRGCPWVLPRPLFTLACKRALAASDDDVRSAYTLRTKIAQEGAADALAKLLNKQHLAAALEVAEMRDGVVAFESDVDAERFASMLEEEGHSGVLVAQVDSHRLFRMATELAALVVLLPAADTPGRVPTPLQLAASLKTRSGGTDDMRTSSSS